MATVGLTVAICFAGLPSSQTEAEERAEHGLAALESKGQRDRNLMWKIVDNCLETKADGYCERCPKPMTTSIGKCVRASSDWDPVTFCKRTTEVWNLTSKFVALKDQKMCGCSDQDFVHGLVFPRARVKGIEDTEHKPREVWQFAWDEATKKIHAREAIALVANPRAHRSQDQLHVHLVRLAEGARRKLGHLAPKRISSLEEVWAAAARHAAETGLSSEGYGIVVVSAAGSAEFLVAAIAGSPEALYTVSRCAR